MALGQFGGALLRQAIQHGHHELDLGLCSGAFHEPTALVLLMDPADRSAARLAVTLIREARARGQQVFAVLRNQSPGGSKCGRSMNETQPFWRKADLVVYVPDPGFRRDVLWEALLAPAYADDLAFAKLVQMLGADKSCTMATVGAACGRSLQHAMTKALEHPLIGSSGVTRAKALLAVMTIGKSKCSLDSVVEASDLLREAASLEDSQLNLSFRFWPSAQLRNHVHLILV